MSESHFSGGYLLLFYGHFLRVEADNKCVIDSLGSVQVRLSTGHQPVPGRIAGLSGTIQSILQKGFRLLDVSLSDFNIRPGIGLLGYGQIVVCLVQAYLLIK